MAIDIYRNIADNAGADNGTDNLYKNGQLVVLDNMKRTAPECGITLGNETKP